MNKLLFRSGIVGLLVAVLVFFAPTTFSSEIFSNTKRVEGAPTVSIKDVATLFGPTRQYTGQWIKENENAWGLTVLMNFPNNSRYIFVPWYTYDFSGNASWYIFQGDNWSDNDTISADVYSYFRYGEGVIPDNSITHAITVVGTATLKFTSDTEATFTYDVNGSSRTITLARLDGAATPPSPLQYTGQWIKADENAWGLTVLMNFPSNPNYVFVPWYTYDVSGQSLWYIFQGELSNNTLSATVFRNMGSPWGGLPYDNDSIVGTHVGAASLTFTSDKTATFSYNVEGSSRTITLTKLE